MDEQSTPSANRLTAILGLLANPTRASILRCLQTGPATFTELLDHCDLDITTQCGLLDHHLQRLVESGLAVKENHLYRLTGKGSLNAKVMVKILEMAGQLLGQNEEGEDVVKEAQDTKRIDVEKFTKENLESFADFWIQKYDMEPTERKRVVEGFSKAVSKRGAIHFLARDSGQIVGYLAGRTVPLQPMPGRSAGPRTHGVLGYIDNIDMKPKSPIDTKTVIAALVDAHEKYFRSKPNCKGTWADWVKPETMNMVFQVLQEKGFYVQNLTAQMRKDFLPGLRPGDLIAAKPGAGKGIEPGTH